MIPLNDYIQERLTTNKNSIVDKHKIAIEDYPWKNEGSDDKLIGSKEMFNNFCDWLIPSAIKLKDRVEMLKVKHNSPILAINKDHKKIALFVEQYGIKYCVINILVRNSNNMVYFQCKDDVGATAVWPLWSTNASTINDKAEYYKIPEELFEEVIEIYNKYYVEE